MYSFMRKEALRKKRTGFSLIELMVVVMIIVVLGGAGTLIAGRVTERTKYARAEKDLETIAGAFMQYINSGGDIATIGLTDGVKISDLKDAKDKLQPFISKDLSQYKTPWKGSAGVVDYVIEYSYTPTTGVGRIVLKVPDDTTAGLKKFTGSSQSTGGVAANRMNEPETPLERLLYRQDEE